MKKIILSVICMSLLLLPIAYAGSIDAIATDSDKISKILDKVKSSNVKFDVFGTEYSTNTQATIWLQYLKDFQPINNASCYMTAYYPNKTIYFSNTLMNYLASSDGVYYYDFVTPSITGVYIVNARCVMPANAFIDDFIDYSKLEYYKNVTIINNKIQLGTTSYATLYPYAWWHLNELSGTNAYDSSGYGHNGTTVNNPSWVAGKLYNSILTASTNQYSKFGNIAGFERTDNFSIEFWVKTADIQKYLFAKRDASYKGYYGVLTATGKIQFGLANTITTNELSVNGNATINDNLWHHILITYDGSTTPTGIKIYVDNILNTNTILTNTLTGSILNLAEFNLGTRTNDATIGFLGYLDEFVIYNKTLTASEISFRYNNGIGTESMGVALDATSGLIQSKSISMSNTSWVDFFSDYNFGNGNMTFKILDQNNNTLCTGLGNITSCANTISPIKLYAQLARPSQNDTSPYIDRWGVSWLLNTFEEVKGSGEMHISTISCDSNATASVNYTYFDNKFNDIYNWFVTTWVNIANTPSNVWSYSPRTVQNITLTNATVTISDQQYDDIALRVIQYFYAMKDKLLTFRLW